MGCDLATVKNSPLAKSDGTTLKEHIEDCLIVFDQLRASLPVLPVITRLPDFWELLFWAVFFHDLGKIHTEFQKALKRERNYWQHQRHEVYSVAFVEKLVLPEAKKLLIQRAILAHHKSFEKLRERHKFPQDLELELALKWKSDKAYLKTIPKNVKVFHPEDFKANFLYRFHGDDLHQLISDGYHLFQRFFPGNPYPSMQKVTVNRLTDPVISIVKPVLKKPFSPLQEEYWQNLFLWGSLKICDHYGSGKITQIHQLKQEQFRFLDALRNQLIESGADFYPHQKQCAAVKGHCILVAPTGSGKTEAALAWARKQMDSLNGRVFYILPYTASINAMYSRLTKAMGNLAVGLVHGKLQQFLTTLFEDHSHSAQHQLMINQQIKNLSELQRKMVYPLKITTPFQVLKHFYGVKGFEMGLTELAGSCLIFDEIHAYDAITFAQIVTVLQFLHQYMGSRVLVMTATLPTFLLKILEKTLHHPPVIQADKQLLDGFTRHRVHLIDGSLPDNIQLILKQISRKMRIIVVCNTVQRAQEMYKLLQENRLLEASRITLLHSRFNGFDRFNKEKQAYDGKTQVLIGTQAIEVSLDIDYDVMFTEPAPLDALLQRFGRVNRKRRKKLADVYVCSRGGIHDFRIYPEPVVKRTLEALQTVDILHESRLQELLDWVYPHWEPAQQQEFEDTVRSFQSAVAHLQPFRDHREEEEAFYEQFDGIDVLPHQFIQEYERRLLNYDFINAQRYMITLHRGMYFMLRKSGLIERHPIAVPMPDNTVNTQQVLIVKCDYDPDVGLLSQESEIQDIDDQLL